MTTQPTDIWVYLESDGDTVAPVSFELLGKARELSGSNNDVTGILVGAQNRGGDFTDDIIARGADTIKRIEDDLLEMYRPETYSTTVGDVINAGNPAAVLFPATHNGIDLAGRLAVRLGTGMNADIVRLERDESGELVGGVPAFAGGILAMVKVTGRPQLSTVRPGVFDAEEPDEQRTGTVEIVEPKLSEDEVVTEIADRSLSEQVDLPSAEVVVCAGRGFGDDLSLAYELSEFLDATIGVTRPLCDAGLVSREHQVGSTGYSLNAQIAICIGISGSVYFTTGLDSVETVIAINTDPDEPIFDYADYCIEGDLNVILPKLISKLEELEVST